MCAAVCSVLLRPCVQMHMHTFACSKYMAQLRLLPPQVLLFGETVAGCGSWGTLQGLLAPLVTYKGYDESMMLQQKFRGCIVSAVLSVLQCYCSFFASN